MRWSAAGIGALGEPRWIALVLAHDVVALTPFDDVLDVGNLMPGMDREQRRVAPHLFVLDHRQAELLAARRVPAFAHDVDRLLAEPERRRELLNPLVHLAKDSLVQADAARSLVHEPQSVRSTAD